MQSATVTTTTTLSTSAVAKSTAAGSPLKLEIVRGPAHLVLGKLYNGPDTFTLRVMGCSSTTLGNVFVRVSLCDIDMRLLTDADIDNAIQPVRMEGMYK